eukprot:scaffold1535_cov382-Prasinococcus_capsulatus_cf.AAC.15
MPLAVLLGPPCRQRPTREGSTRATAASGLRKEGGGRRGRADRPCVGASSPQVLTRARHPDRLQAYLGHAGDGGGANRPLCGLMMWGRRCTMMRRPVLPALWRSCAAAHLSMLESLSLWTASSVGLHHVVQPGNAVNDAVIYRSAARFLSTLPPGFLSYETLELPNSDTGSGKIEQWPTVWCPGHTQLASLMSPKPHKCD